MGEVLVQLLPELEQHRLEFPLPLLPLPLHHLCLDLALCPRTAWALLAPDLVQLLLLLGKVLGSCYGG